MKSIISSTPIILLAFLITSCGGGGGGGGSSEPSNPPSPVVFPENMYDGSESNASVTANSAMPVSLSAVEMVDIIEEMAYLPVGNTFDRIYFTLPEGEQLGGTFDGDETTCDGGDYSVADNRNSEGIGTVTLNFQDCILNGDTVDGIYKLDISRSGTNVVAETTLEGLRLVSTTENIDVVINGVINQVLEDSITFDNNSPWSADVVIEYNGRGYQTFAKNFERVGLGYRDYQITGEFFHSDFGRFTLNIDSSDATISVGGENSGLTGEYSVGRYNPGAAGYTTLQFTFQLDSDGDDVSEQSVTLSTEQLINYFTSENLPPVAEIDGSEATEKGNSLTLNLLIEDQTPDFIATDWQASGYTGECRPSVERLSHLEASVASDCSGEVIAKAVVSDGRNDLTVEKTLTFYRYLPQVEFVQPPETLTIGQPFTVAVMENNPEEGPFSYGPGVAVDGVSVESNGTLSWDGSEIPRVTNPIEITFGVSVTNDRSVLSTFTSTLTFENFVEPIKSGYPTAVAVNFGAVDLEPDNPDGDITFFRYGLENAQQVGHDQLIKYNKSSNTFRKVDIGQYTALDIRYLNRDTREYSVTDVNGDQRPDLVQALWSSGTVNIVAYDLYNETWILNESMFSTATNTTASFSDVYFIDIDDNGTKEFVFLAVSRILLDNGVFAPAGVYRYTPGTFEAELLFNLTDNAFDISGSMLVVKDIDGDNRQDLIVATDRNVHILKQVNGEFAPANSSSDFSGLHLSDLRIDDIDGDNQQEVVLVATTESNKSFCPRDDFSTRVIVFNEDLEIQRQYDLENTLIAGISNDESRPQNGNFYTSGVNCATDEGFFSYFNLYWGESIWERTFVVAAENAAWLSARNSVTSFFGPDGRIRLALGGGREIIVTQ